MPDYEFKSKYLLFILNTSKSSMKAFVGIFVLFEILQNVVYVYCGRCIYWEHPVILYWYKNCFAAEHCYPPHVHPGAKLEQIHTDCLLFQVVILLDRTWEPSWELQPFGLAEQRDLDNHYISVGSTPRWQVTAQLPLSFGWSVVLIGGGASREQQQERTTESTQSRNPAACLR